MTPNRRRAIVVMPRPVVQPTAAQLAAEEALRFAASIRRMTKRELVSVAREHGINPAGLLKAQLVGAILTMHGSD